MIRKIMLIFMLAVSPVWAGKNVTVVSSSGAGSASDLTLRVIQKSFNSRTSEYNLVIETVTGASGILAVNRVLNSNEPLILNGNTSIHVINPVTMPEQVKYSIKDFDPVGFVNHIPSTMIVAKDSPIKTWDDLISTAKQREVLVGVTHSIGESEITLLNQKLNLKLRPVRYKTPVESLTGVAGGHHEVSSVSINDTVLGQVKAGRVRIVATNWSKDQIIEGVSVPSYPARHGIQPLIGSATLVMNKKFSTEDSAKIKRLLHDTMADEEVRKSLVQMYSVPANVGDHDLSSWIEKSQQTLRKTLNQ